MTEGRQGMGMEMPEEDVVMLEALIKSPVFAALKRLLEGYRKECFSKLCSSKDTHEIYQTQGRIIGMQVVEGLPGIVVRQRAERVKREEEKRQQDEEVKKRTTPRPLPPPSQ